MKPINRYKLLGILFIAMAIIIISYALANIIGAKKELAKTLDDWEKNVEIDLSEIDEEETENTIRYPSIEYGDTIGKLTFLDTELPIITGVEDSLLDEGVLHYGPTPLPGTNGNSILLGHRDSTFKNLKKLELGQHFIIETKYNQFEFQIFDIKILKSDDTSVFDSYDFPTVSMETCYPFNYIGSAPKRYIVVGKLIQSY